MLFRSESKHFKNCVINLGKYSIVKGLTNEYGGAFELYVSSMLFGTNGAVGGTPRVVEGIQTGMFGPAVISKPVVARPNDTLPNQAVFTAVLLKTDAVGEVLNEMALQLQDGTVFSVATFGDITKSNTMQMTWNWRITFI